MKTKYFIIFIYLLSYINIFSANSLINQGSFELGEPARLKNLPSNKKFSSSTFKLIRTPNTLGNKKGLVKIRISDSRDNSEILYENFNELEKEVSLPTNGQRLNITMFSQNGSSGRWKRINYEILAAKGIRSEGQAAELINLPDNMVFSSSTFKLIRTPNTLGNKKGLVKIRISDSRDNSEILYENFNELEKEVSLPTNGQRLNITMFSQNGSSGRWKRINYEILAAKGIRSEGQAAELINLPDNMVFSSSTFKLIRTPNTLSGQNGYVYLRIINVESRAILYNQPFKELEKQVTGLPDDGCRLLIILFSYNYKKEQWSQKEYRIFAARGTRSEGRAAELRNLLDSRIFSGTTFRFRRTKNTLSGQNGYVYLRIINVESRAILYNQPFKELEKQVTGLPDDGCRLLIILFSYNYRTEQWSQKLYRIFASERTTSR